MPASIDDTTVKLQSDGPPLDGPAGSTIALEPRSKWGTLELRELWQHRELVAFLAMRDVKVRYKQTVLGAAWAVLQPFLTMIVFSVFFGKLARVGSDGAPYPLFAFSALVPWQLFAFSLAHAGNSLVSDQGLIRKVYFPRLALPLASLLAGIPDFLVSTAILMLMMAAYGFYPSWRILLLPVLAAFALLAAFSVGIWLAAFNVKYRDFRYTIPFVVQLWLFASPVAYSSSLVPDHWRVVYALNPMTVVIEGFRWALLGTAAPSYAGVVSLGIAIVLLIAGLIHFHHVQNEFADVV